MTSHRIIQGDCIEGLRTLPDAIVHCCVTSPPYWGLRDCGHDGQIGLESTPEAYVARMVEVFREVRRVLRDDGTCWVNLGDSYAATTKGSGGPDSSSTLVGTKAERNGQRMAARKMVLGSIKPKDLVGIPWRVAFALQADGWWLRQDIIWHKPNPMPESVRDRCTKAHEYVFLLTKSERYFYDAEAVKEAAHGSGGGAFGKVSMMDAANAAGQQCRRYKRPDYRLIGRNRRSVWTITTKPYSGAHFAVMPADLVQPCILAGCPEGGTVLDPFAGSGTTLAVAAELGRSGIGCELNPEYIELAEQRIAKSKAKMPLFVA
jgi:DNA modification methylase